MKPSKYIKSDILNSILNFAIEGKLVKQSSDTADDFIKLCKAKKSEFQKIKSMKKSIDFDKPFDIPNNWRWEKLDNLILISTGASFRKEAALSSPKNGYIRVLRGGNVLNLDYSFFDNDLFIPKNLVSDDILLRKNDLISPSVTSIENIGKIGCIKEKINNTTAGGFVFIFRPFVNNETFSELFSLFFSSPLFSATLKSITKKSGEAFYNLNKELLRNLWFPVPPLVEQEKIVKKFHQLKPLIDKYEELERERSDLNVKLKDQIKKSILRYAIRGKTTKQLSSDTNVFTTLSKIKANDIKQPGKDFFDIPSSWAWVKLKDIVKEITAGGDKPEHFSKVETKNYTIPVISNGEKNEGIFGYTDIPTVTEEALTVSGRGTIGYTKIRKKPFYPIVRLLVIKPLAEIDINYLSYAIESLVEFGEGSATKQLTVPMISNKLIPLPPIEEQKRIVERIQKLLPFCEQLDFNY